MGLDSALRQGGSLFDTPRFGEIVDRPELHERQAADLARALQYEVGVLVQQTARGQASPFVRGLTGQQVLILVDGVRLNNPTFRAGPNQYFNLVDPGQVERIEIIRGPQSVLWGSDALGGVINIVTRTADAQRGMEEGVYFAPSLWQLFSTADTASYTRGNLEGWVGIGGVFAGASFLNVNELDRGGHLGTQPFTNYDQYAGDIKFNALLNDDLMLTAALQHLEQDGVPRSDRFPPFVFQGTAAPRPTFFDPQQRDLTYLRLQGLADCLLFDAISTTFSYQRNKESSTEFEPTVVPNRLTVLEFEDESLGYTLVFAKDCEWLGRFTYGGDWYYDDLRAFRNRYTAPAFVVPAPQNPQFPDDSRYIRAGGFLNWDVDLTARLRGEFGVRFEHAHADGTINNVSGLKTPFSVNFNDWIGSAGLSYELVETLRLVGSISEGFRAPNLDDLTSDNTILQGSLDLPSLDVQPEHSITYEVGLKLDDPRMRGQVVQFWTDLQDTILRQRISGVLPGTGNFIRDNFDSYIYGTEFAGELLLTEDGWSVYGNFWYLFGRDRDRDEPFSRIPPAQGVAGVRWREEERRFYIDLFTWLVRHQDRLATQNLGDARFPVGGNAGYGLLNFRAGAMLDSEDHHRLTLSLENIFDKAYRVLGSGVDGPGFNAILGYEWQR
jgi:outer membrane receptor protein involved in Fe transport